MQLRYLFAAIVVLSIFTNFYRLEHRHVFDWDQERDAQVVYSRMIVEQKPTLLGPRVVGPEGFFLGPLHYYLLLPFYFVLQGDPIAGSVAAALVGVLTTCAYMYIALRLFSRRAALFAGLLSALMPITVSWNVMYMPAVTIFLYYFLLKVIQGETRFIVPSFILVAIAFHFHFTAIFLFATLVLAVALATLSKKIRKSVIIESVKGIILLVFSFLPLVLFDFRHNFLNSRNMMPFFFSDGASAYDHERVATIFLRTKTFLSHVLTPYVNSIVNILLAGMALLEMYKFGKRREQLLTFVWLVLPVAVLSFYGGEIPEYYFVTSFSIILLLFASALSRVTVKLPIAMVTYACLAILTVVFIKSVTSANNFQSMHYKKQVVEYLKLQSENSDIEISFDSPLGLKIGFEYLVEYYDIQVSTKSDATRYTVYLPPHIPKDMDYFQFGPYYVTTDQ